MLLSEWPTLKMESVLAGRYRILRPLAEGGMGTVFLARQVALGRLVAIKTLCPRATRYGELVMRLRREARAIQQLSHPNTVRVYDFGESQGLLFLAMEYLEGDTLEEVVAREGALSPARVVHIGTQVLKSLAEAHGCGIVHRDIKPANLMLCKLSGERDFVKVLDFGLARVSADTGPPATLQGETLGTPNYMSPEQVRGLPADARSDLYALGLTLYELVTGRRAYNGGSPYEIAIQHLDDTGFEMPDELLGTPLGRVIERATRKQPAERYQSAAEMLADLCDEPLDLRVWEGSEQPDPTGESLRMDSGPLEVGPDTLDPLPGAERTAEVAPRPGRIRRPVLWTSAAAAILLLGTSGPFSVESDVSLPAWAALAAEGISDAPSSSAATAEEVVGEVTEEAVVEGASLLPRPESRAPEASAEVASAVTAERAIPAESSLAIQSAPPGASVWLNGAELCVTPCERRLSASLGVQAIEVRLAGHTAFAGTVDLSRDVLLAVLLEPAAVSSAVPAEGGEADPEADARLEGRSSRRRGGQERGDDETSAVETLQIPIDF